MSHLLSQTKEVLPLVQRVIAQTSSPVLEGKKLVSDKKVLSLFEPHGLRQGILKAHQLERSRVNA
jgi:hypothetical protein